MMENNSSTTVDEDDMVVPVIDFAPFISGTPVEKHAVAISITDAFKNSGFLHLKDHGIPRSTITEVFASSARFFARPQDQKDSVCWTTPQANRGYIATGKKRVSQVAEACSVEALRATNPDIKETMEIMREGVEDAPNRWPDHLDEEGKAFKRVMLSFYDQCKDLHMQIMRAIALGLNLPEHFFDEFIKIGDNNLRLLHYPPVSKEIFQKQPGKVRAGEHTDYGTVTLLFQDARGGLQARSPKGTFVDVTPIPDTIVVNAGDLLARWSNDAVRSTRHRVVEPPIPAVDETEDSSDMHPSRYSIAYFCNPDLETVIETLPGTYGIQQQTQRRYPGIKAGDYIVVFERLVHLCDLLLATYCRGNQTIFQYF